MRPVEDQYTNDSSVLSGNRASWKSVGLISLIEKEIVHPEFYFLQKYLSKMKGKIKSF